jgi:hypothetical protein
MQCQHGTHEADRLCLVQSVSQAVSVNYRRELQKARGKLVVES